MSEAVASEFWIVKAEWATNGEKSLAYWGPFASRAAAEASDMYGFDGDERIVELEAPQEEAGE